MNIKLRLAAVAMGAMISCSSFAQAPATSATSAANSAKAHLDLAVSYFQSGQFETAQSEAQRALKDEPKNSQALMLMGLIHMQMKELPRAEEMLRAAIAADANNGDAYNNYGLLLCQTNRIDASIEQFGRAMSSPRYSKVSQTLVNAGICLTQKNDYAAAEKYFLKALEQDPFMPSALYQLSRAYLKGNRVDLAENRLEALHRQITPNSASLYLESQIARAKGDSAKAQRLAERVNKQFPNSPEARRVLAGEIAQ